VRRKICFLTALFFLLCQSNLNQVQSGERLISSSELRAKENIARLALQQAENITPYWSEKQRDCAGLIRFLYRQAVTAKSKTWVDHSGKKTEYVGAAELISYNFTETKIEIEHFGSLDGFKTGDLLVYYNPLKPPKDAWHLMMLIEPFRGTRDEALVVYHNGATDRKASVRKIWLRQLFDKGWEEWQPSKNNPLYKGVFRWKGWGDSV
jgi:uncharacterized protein